jgi:ATP-dependent exoDNAse (exonuclease V) beta subunit
MLWPAVEGDFSAAFDAGKIAGDEEDVAFLQPVRRRFGAPWSPPAVSPLPEGVRRAEDAGPDEQEREFYWVGTEARIAGTIVHRWLQVLADGKLDGDPTDLALRDDLTRRWLREIGIAEPQHERIATRVSAALDGVLEDARGRWVLDGAGHAELALTGIYDGRVESVVLDRVRIDEAGRHWIIDYKTSSHEGGNLQGFLEAELDRYTPQLRKYADIYAAFSGEQPHCALYFPLLQEFIEVQ